MVGCELNRAKNWIVRNDFQEVRLCYERALELLYLTIASTKKKTRVHELTRFKEVLSGLYLEEVPSVEKNTKIYNTLISLSSESYSLLHP